jgi:hypothetical protein
MLPVTVVVPVLRRPHHAEPFMASLRSASPRCPLVLAVANRDDRATAAAWRRAGATIVWCDTEPGSFAQKVNLVARIVGRHTDWLFLTGDDVAFHDGWIDAALTDLDPHVKVVGTNDLGTDVVQRGEHATHMFVATDYIATVGASWDGPGTVAGGYRHWYVDDEIVTVAKLRGVWEARTDSVVEHLHHLFGKGLPDETYRLGQSASDADAELWMERVTKFAPELLETP